MRPFGRAWGVEKAGPATAVLLVFGEGSFKITPLTFLSFWPSERPKDAVPASGGLVGWTRSDSAPRGNQGVETIWLWVKTNGIPFWLVGEFTTHFSTYFRGI